MKEKRLITSALTYVNNIPHVGHIVGCHLPADIFARFCRARGYDTTFVGGSDMHGTPSLITSQEVGIDVVELTHKLHQIHDKIYKKLNISYDIYSNTHTKTHEEVTSDFFMTLYKKNYIKTGETEMFYCEKCKMFLADRFVEGTCPHCHFEGASGDQCEKCDSLFSSNELLNAHCKICGTPAVIKSSKHIFLDLNKGVKMLEEFIESKKDIFRPHVYKEAKRWIEEGLKDRCISRDITWGFKVPLKEFENKVFYVWFDAPIGYISITKELSAQKYNDLWRNKDAKIYHFVGKDNIQFHTVFFPTMLLENGEYNLPYNVVGLNFLNYEGQKFSKSKRLGVFCNALLDDNLPIDIDTLRGYLTTIIPENRDTDFKWEDYKNNTNSELVGKFGNLFNRSLNMIKNYLNGEIKKDISSFNLNELDKEALENLKNFTEKIIDLYEKVELREVYKTIMSLCTIANTYIERSTPWALYKEGKIEEVEKVLSITYNFCKNLCLLMSPILPDTCQKLYTEQMGIEENIICPDAFLELNTFNPPYKIKSVSPIFSRIDDEKLNEIKEALSTPFDINDYFKN